MPTIANEPLPGASATNATSKSNGPAGRRTEAVGVEIPVVIHASRNSAFARETGKTLPVVHEETRTVIVFPQGAVVRLTAMVTTGELVVLTNQRSGADVLCRVASIKAQPGIQNYVDLEFTQRAPGFWGDCFPPERSAVSGLPAATAPPPVPAPQAVPTVAPAPMAPAVLTIPAPNSVSASPLNKTAPVTPASVFIPRPQVISTASTVTPPVMPPPPPVAPAETQPAVHSFGTASAGASDRDLSRSLSATQNWALRSEPQFHAGESRSGSKKILLVGAAAIVLLAALGGGYMLRGRTAAAPSQPANNVANVPASQPVATPATSSVPVSAPLQNSAVQAAPAARPAVATAGYNAQPPAVRAADPVVANSEPVIPPPPTASELRQAAPHTLSAVGKLSQPVARKAAEAGSAELPPVLPVNVGTSPLETTLLNAEQTTTLAAPTTVIPPSLTGGRVQQPKLISSQAPTYPPTASAQRIQGEVVVDALVDATGKVTATKVISGQPLLQQAAMNAVHAWKYEPARLDGEAIPSHIQVKITFRLP